jgi:uncharacterized protein (TIGR02453 family)
MAFTGWPASAIDFYDGLDEDNSRDYWHAHRATYDQAVKAPMQNLLDALADEFGEGRIFRPNRDVRFSADKSPYKTAIGATLDGGGYVQLSAAGLGVGTGIYHMASDQLERFRTAIDADRTGTELVELARAARAAGMDVSAHGTLKTSPRGYARDHPRIELLRLKGLIVWREWPAGAWLNTRKPLARVVEVFRRAGPLVAWLDINVGASDLPDPFAR